MVTDRLPNVGGNGGGFFSDSSEVVHAGPISRIEIRAGEFIDAIRVTYGRGAAARAGAWHGGGGGGYGAWDVPEGMAIEAVHGRHGDYVDQLSFIAMPADQSSAARSPWWGGPGGNRFDILGDWIDVSRGERNPLVEICGCCGEFVDRLYFRFKSNEHISGSGANAPAPLTWSPTEPPVEE